VGEVTIRRGATGARAGWAGREAEAQWEEGGAVEKKRMGRDWAERPDGPEVTEKISFSNKILFLNIPWLWKFAQGDLGEILT
jgi:hypothetical protein